MTDGLIYLGTVRRAPPATIPLARLSDLETKPRMPSAAVAAAMIRNQQAILAALTIAADALAPEAGEKLKVGARWSVQRILRLLGEAR
jgi:hypothetical protein